MVALHPAEWTAVGWFAGWSLAIGVLLIAGFTLPVFRHGRRGLRRCGEAGLFGLGLVLLLLANLAVALHDMHFDLTWERTFTPDPAALAVADALDAPVRVTFFYRERDPEGERARRVLATMARRNPLLEVIAADPDREPALAAALGVALHNIAVVEAADGRRVMVRGTDERDFALGIERVLRRHQKTVCFAEGHGEYASENHEFHTHLDSAVGHAHGDAEQGLVDTTTHGYGRLRRALEGQGHAVQTLLLANHPVVPRDCDVLIEAGPRTRMTHREATAITRHLETGGSLWLLLEPDSPVALPLAEALRGLGIKVAEGTVIDPQSHPGEGRRTLTITRYVAHPVTRGMAMALIPGARPLQALPGRRAEILFSSSPESRRVGPGTGHTGQAAYPLALAAEMDAGTGGRGGARVIVTGDADFASNSYFPYASNSALSLAMLRWLLHEEERPGISPRIPVPPQLVLEPAQARLVSWLCLWVLPGVPALVAGWFGWRRR